MPSGISGGVLKLTAPFGLNDFSSIFDLVYVLTLAHIRHFFRWLANYYCLNTKTFIDVLFLYISNKFCEIMSLCARKWRTVLLLSSQLFLKIKLITTNFFFTTTIKNEYLFFYHHNFQEQLKIHWLRHTTNWTVIAYTLMSISVYRN